MRPLAIERGLLDMPTTTTMTPVTPNLDLPGPPEPHNHSTTNPTPSTSATETPAPTSSVEHGSGSHMVQANHIDMRAQAEMLARQRVADSMAKSKPALAPQKHRTCRKCAKLECPGSQKVSNCQDPCRDCRTINCRGRNSKHPEKTCYEGWD
jgi:hypothetical protein